MRIRFTFLDSNLNNQASMLDLLRVDLFRDFLSTRSADRDHSPEILLSNTSRNNKQYISTFILLYNAHGENWLQP